MSHTTQLASLADAILDYTKIRDCVAGERAVKKKTTAYLPKPDPTEDTAFSAERYNTYLERAVFYGATGRTLGGLVGLVFDKDPATELPSFLLPLLDDVSGEGMSLRQQAQSALSETLQVGRAGILADYPRSDKVTTVADARAGNIRPIVRLFKAEDIINWRTRLIGAKSYLSLVVLKEAYAVEDDGFAEVKETRYRVLRLNDSNVYQVSLYTEEGLVEEFIPVGGDGRPLSRIPFSFIGAKDNTPSIDTPPLLDVATLNIAHYRNSADYEESVFLVGQPTPVFSGLTQDWVDRVFRVVSTDGHGATKVTQTVKLGSRVAVPLPENGSASLLQAAPNTLAFEAMEHKEKQLIALGAKLITPNTVEQTATEATLDTVLDNSVLATAARNVSAAYRQVLCYAAWFSDKEKEYSHEEVDFSLSTDFSARLMTAADRNQVVSEWLRNAITFEEMRWNLKRAGVAYEPDNQAREKITEEAKERLLLEGAVPDAGNNF
jgi:hypothetical protein